MTARRTLYHILPPSLWPITCSLSILILLIGLVSVFQEIVSAGYIILLGLINTSLGVTFWYHDIIQESLHKKKHTNPVSSGLRLGFILFLVSEVMLFGSFFGSYFYVYGSPTIEIGLKFPPELITAVSPYGLSLLNTLLLLASGYTLTVYLLGKKFSTRLKGTIGQYKILQGMKGGTTIVFICAWAVFWLYLYARIPDNDSIPDNDNIACIVVLSGSAYDSYRKQLLNAISQLEKTYQISKPLLECLTQLEVLQLCKNINVAGLAHVDKIEKSATGFIAALIMEKNVPKEKANKFYALVLRYVKYIVEDMLILNDPHTTYYSFLSYNLQFSTMVPLDGADLRKWITSVEEEFKIKVVESAVGYVDEEEVVGCVSSGKTFRECKVNLLFAVDKFNRERPSMFDREAEPIKRELIKSREKIDDNQFLFLANSLREQYILNSFIVLLREFNKTIRPAGNQLMDFLLSQKNVSQEKANELSQVLDTYAGSMQEVIDMMRIREDSERSTRQEKLLQLMESIGSAELRLLELLDKLIIEFPE